MREEGRRSGTIGRREAIRRMAAGTAVLPAAPAARRASARPGEAIPGMTTSGAKGLGYAQPADPSLASPSRKPKFFDTHQNATIVELSDLIIPAADTLGAKAAQVNRFVDLLLNDSQPDSQKRFIEALGQLDGYCVDQHGNAFLRLSAPDQQAVLTVLTHSSSDPCVCKKIESFWVLKSAMARAITARRSVWSRSGNMRPTRIRRTFRDAAIDGSAQERRRRRAVALWRLPQDY
jgi:Gluconate 2-dehydrogenase subunit 3